jgi:hypothetical protein
MFRKCPVCGREYGSWETSAGDTEVEDCDCDRDGEPDAQEALRKQDYAK